jgi:hypothetical protein
MESLLHANDREKVQIWMAAFAVLCLLIFAFSPLPTRSSDPGSPIYMVEGHGEQWFLLIFAISIAILVYFQIAYAALVAAIGFLMTLLSVIYQFYSGTYRPWREIGVWRVFGVVHIVTFSRFQILTLMAGTVFLIAPVVWVLWLEWETLWNGRPAKSAAAAPPRYFDPRSIDPLATTGFCYNCGTKNPLSRNQCLQCNVNLPWLRSSPAPLPAKPVQRQNAKQDFFVMPSLSVDWTVLGIGLLSLLVWPLGLVLFFAFSKRDEEKGNAAIIGACLALALFVLRFVLLMAKAVH